MIAPVELQRPVDEPCGVAILQGGDLPRDLVPLRPEQRVQRRVGDVLDLEVVEVTPHQIRLELQRSEPERGDGSEVTPLEVCPCLRRVDRRDVQQQVQAALDLGEAGVDLQRTCERLRWRSHLVAIPTYAYTQP